jgi:hypothetical protein
MPTHEGAALGLERAGLAVVLAREVDHRAFFRHPVAWPGEQAMIFPQLFAARANIAVALGIEGEVAARKRAVRALRLVEHPHMRFDPALVDQLDCARYDQLRSA